MANSNVYWRKKQEENSGKKATKAEKKAVEEKKPAINTLCWKCGNACGGCRWSRDFEPVPGWVAVPTRIGHYGLESFLVMRCPQFREEAVKTYSSPDQLDSDGAEKLVQAIIRTAADDYRESANLRPEVTRFFRSRVFAAYTGIDPEYLIGRLQTEVKMKMADKVRL